MELEKSGNKARQGKAMQGKARESESNRASHTDEVARQAEIGRLLAGRPGWAPTLEAGQDRTPGWRSSETQVKSCLRADRREGWIVDCRNVNRRLGMWARDQAEAGHGMPWHCVEGQDRQSKARQDKASTGKGHGERTCVCRSIPCDVLLQVDPNPSPQIDSLPVLECRVCTVRHCKIMCCGSSIGETGRYSMAPMGRRWRKRKRREVDCPNRKRGVWGRVENWIGNAGESSRVRKPKAHGRGRRGQKRQKINPSMRK